MMKKLTAILGTLALTVACGGGGGPVRPPDEAAAMGSTDQRRRGDVSVSDLFEVVF